MNAIAFLINEHNQVRKMLKEIGDESHRDNTKQKMFAALCEELIRHETMEQTIWYPVISKNEKLKDTVDHLIAEEKSAEKTMKEFNAIENQEEWDEKFTEFKKDVEHHASEEESKLFPKVDVFLNEKELERIGKIMHEFKKEYLNKKAA